MFGRRLAGELPYCIQYRQVELRASVLDAGATCDTNGRATQFKTVDELLAFIQRVLARLRESPGPDREA